MENTVRVEENIFNPISPAAKILVPLLDALNWKGENSKMLEALGEGADNMDTDKLIETLANLNFKHKRMNKVKGYDIDKRLLPLLIINKTKHLLVVSIDGEHSLVFDGQTASYREEKTSSIYGDMITFQYAEYSGEHLIGPQENWFGKLIYRFRKSFAQVAFITFIITLLDLMLPVFVTLIYDRIMLLKEYETLIIVFAGVLGYVVSSFLLNRLRFSVMNYLSNRMGNIISEQTFSRLVYLSPAYTETASVNSQIARIKDFENIKKFILSGNFTAVFELVFSVIYILAMFYIGGWIAIIPVFALVLLILIGIAMKPLHKIKMEKVSESSAARQQNLLEILKNTDEIKASGSKEQWIERTRKISADNIIKNYELSDYVSFSNNLSFFIMNVAALAIIYGGVLQVFSGRMTTGSLIGILMLYWKTSGSIRGAFSLVVQLSGLQKSVNQINRFMKLPQDTNLKTTMSVSREIKGHVRFIDVSIRYNSISNPALLNVSFSNLPGQILGITGHDGAGKTTILKLLLNMYKPQGGRILLDNINIQQMEPLSLRRLASYSPQNDMILTGTIRENFKSYDPSITDTRIIELANKTGLSEYFTTYGYQLDTKIDEQTIKEMSLSFKRLLNLTRMLSRKSKLYLIDEPENHLDRASLERILPVIKSLAKEQGASVIISSKEPSVLNICDNIIRLNQGSIIQ